MRRDASVCSEPRFRTMSEASEIEDREFVEGDCVLFVASITEDQPTSRPGGFLSQFWNKYGVVGKNSGDDAAAAINCAFFVAIDGAVKKIVIKLNPLSLQRSAIVPFQNEAKALLVNKDGTVEAITVCVGQKTELLKADGGKIDYNAETTVVPIYGAVGEVAADKPNALIEALVMQSAGKFVRMKPVLREHADQINQVYNGTTPLLYAIENEMWQAARSLIAHGALVSARNADGNNAYHLAVLANQSSLISEFSKKNLCGVNAKNAQGKRPLHLAIDKNHFGCMNALISSPLADLNARDANGDTALHMLARKDETKHVLAVIEKILSDSSIDYAKRNQKGLPMFEEAILHEHEKTVSLICQTTPGVLLLQNGEGNFPVHLTTKLGNCQILHTILNYNVDIALSLNLKGQTPLHLAVKSWEGEAQNHIDRLACIQNLVDMKVDLNLQDENGETIGHYLAREALKMDPPGDDILRLLRREELSRSNVRLVNFAQAIWPHYHVAAFCYLVLMGLDLFTKDKSGFAVIDHFSKATKLADIFEEYASKRILQKRVSSSYVSESAVCSRSCGGKKSNVRFIPCGHIVMCSECAAGVKLRRCSKCYSKVSKAVCVEDGNEIQLNEPAVADSKSPEKADISDSRKQDLLAQIGRLKTLLTCKICEKRRTNTILLTCGHMACSVCSAPELLSKCHFCQADIEKRVHLYR